MWTLETPDAERTPWAGPRGGRIVGALVLALLATGLGLARTPGVARAAAGQFCSGENLAVGANWSVCWEMRANEGLAITHAFYTKQGFDRRVLADSTVAQVFVPYEVGQPRYHDVSYGLGAGATVWARADCPGGALLGGGKVCRMVESHGLAERFCANGCRGKMGQALILMSSSQMGAYNYITRWTFHDDGTIEPAVGMGGVLQFGNTAHAHNIYWRLDVDIDDPEGDEVDEFYRIAPVRDGGLKGANGWTPLLGETYRPNDLITFRKWRVIDTQKKNRAGKNWGYELIPSPGNGDYRGTTAEGFTRGELWVTHARSSERFVSTETADLLSSYLNGESVLNTDVVLWYAVHAYHEVRSEDSPYMPVMWVGFELRPRDYFDQNPLD